MTETLGKTIASVIAEAEKEEGSSALVITGDKDKLIQLGLLFYGSMQVFLPKIESSEKAKDDSVESPKLEDPKETSIKPHTPEAFTPASEKPHEKAARLYHDKAFRKYLRANITFTHTKDGVRCRVPAVKEAVISNLLLLINGLWNGYTCGRAMKEVTAKSLDITASSIQAMHSNWFRSQFSINDCIVLVQAQKSLKPSSYKGKASASSIWYGVGSAAVSVLEKLISSYKG